MEGEVIRDSLLLLAGRLDPTMGGPDLPIDFAEAGRRRTLYYRVARDERIPLLTAFDAPNVEDCYRRHETIVPQQALAMINSGMVLTRAGQIAAAIDREVGADPLPRLRGVRGRRPLNASSAGHRTVRSSRNARRAWRGSRERSRRKEPERSPVGHLKPEPGPLSCTCS